jgi:hypothetical protein
VEHLGGVVATTIDDEQKVRKNSSYERMKQEHDEDQ